MSSFVSCQVNIKQPASPSPGHLYTSEINSLSMKIARKQYTRFSFFYLLSFIYFLTPTSGHLSVSLMRRLCVCIFDLLLCGNVRRLNTSRAQKTGLVGLVPLFSNIHTVFELDLQHD